MRRRIEWRQHAARTGLALLLLSVVRLHGVVWDPELLGVGVNPARVASRAVATFVAIQQHLRRRPHRWLRCVVHDAHTVGQSRCRRMSPAAVAVARHVLVSRQREPATAVLKAPGKGRWKILRPEVGVWQRGQHVLAAGWGTVTEARR